MPELYTVQSAHDSVRTLNHFEVWMRVQGGAHRVCETTRLADALEIADALNAHAPSTAADSDAGEYYANKARHADWFAGELARLEEAGVPSDDPRVDWLSRRLEMARYVGD